MTMLKHKLRTYAAFQTQLMFRKYIRAWLFEIHFVVLELFELVDPSLFLTKLLQLLTRTFLKRSMKLNCIVRVED